MSQETPDLTFCLAVETSGSIGSVSLGRGDTVLESAEFSADQRHAVELLPTVQGLCRRHDLTPMQIEQVYVSGGPGSFTGLRIGITFAKSLALGGPARIVRVPTLDVIAQNALRMDDRPTHLAVLLDAKRGRVYAAGFEWAQDGAVHYRRTIEPAEVDPAQFLGRMPAGTAVVGEGVAFHRGSVESGGLLILPERFNRARSEVVYTLGRRCAAAGRFDDATTLTPIYVRRPEAEEVFEQRRLDRRNG